MKEETTIIGRDGIEYVVSGGKIIEKCQHKTRTDKSSGRVRHEVCHDCGKTLIYNDESKTEHKGPVERFEEMHGRQPNSYELSAMI